MKTKELTVTIERERRGQWDALYRGYLKTGGQVYFLGKVITNDENTAREYFADGVKKRIYGTR